MGKEQYRNRLVATRKTHPDKDPIPEEIKIAREGEVVRLFGAFIENDMDNQGIWAPTVETVAKDLSRWSKSNPTIEKKRLIVNMIVRGHTQHRTEVQEMLKQVENELTNMIRRFIWGENSKHTIGLDMLCLLDKKGGQKLLNLNIRNKAIELMKTK